MKNQPLSDVIVDAIRSGLATAQRQGKVETPKPADKSKFRPVLARTQGRTAMPGEARELANSEGFKTRCGHAGIPATRRQAAKYLQKRGALWNYEHKTIGDYHRK